MCLPIPRGPPPASRGKSPPSSSSSSSGSSSEGAPPVSSRRHRRRNPHSASTESDLRASRIVKANTRPQQELRYSVSPSRKQSIRKSSRASSVAGSVPSRRPSMRASRDAARLAPGSPQMGTPRSPAFSARSEKPSRSPSKKQHPLSASNSTSRRKTLETPVIQQTPYTTPRAPPPAVLSGRKEKRKVSGKMDERDSIIALRAPLRDGGVVSGLMVIRPGSSRRDSESGSSRSKSSSRKSELDDRKRERPGSGSSSGISGASTLVPVGLGISLDNSRTPTPTSKAKVERIREIETRPSRIPTIAIAAPTPEKQAPKLVPQTVPRIQVQPPPPVPAPKPPVVNISPPKAVAPPVTIATYPIMATLVYPTKDQLAYQPITRYQVTTPVTPSKVPPPPPPPPAIIQHAASPASAAAHPPPAPPALQQYQDPFNSPASSIHGVPLTGGSSPALSQQSSMSSVSAVSSSSSSTSGATGSVVTAQEPSTPIAQQIPYVPNAAVSPGSSASSLVTASSSASSSATQSSNYFRAEPPRAPTPDVKVPELSNRKPNYYRYSAPQDTTPKPVKAIMDSPNPAAKRAGPWDGMPGADPNLGAYYRNAAAAKRREATTVKPAPSTSKDTSVDAANLAAYYRQAEAQKRKLALERMKHEQSETEDETSASEISGVSEPWVDPNLAGYYRAAEASKKKQEPTVKRTAPSTDKALIPSPVKEPLKGMVAGRNVIFSSIRRSIPARFRSAPHSPHVPFAPPPAPTPPPGEDARSTIGGEDGPPEGAANSWFKKASMAAGPGDGRQEAPEYWTSPSETTLPGASAEGGAEFPSTAPPPAPTPPLAREEAVPPGPGYYTRSPRAGGYGYHG